MMHTCPGGCGDQNITSSRFACRTCWYRLPAVLRSAIWRAYQDVGALSAPHRAAMADAHEWYRNNPTKTPAA
jgi:hypothetical protein